MWTVGNHGNQVYKLPAQTLGRTSPPDAINSIVRDQMLPKSQTGQVRTPVPARLPARRAFGTLPCSRPHPRLVGLRAGLWGGPCGAAEVSPLPGNNR